MHLDDPSTAAKRRAARQLLDNVVNHDNQMELRSRPDAPRSENWFRFEDFPESKVLHRKVESINELGIRNPFFRVGDGPSASTMTVAGRDYVNYGSYNYLGFAGDARINQAVKDAVDRYGTSVSASRIVGGERLVHRELEQELADLIGAEDCLVFVGGYSTNVTVIGHLLGPGDLILQDSLCHNSIVSGCLLSGAKRLPFPHNDVDRLEEALEQNRRHFGRVLIVVEGVYSMDGDIVPLPRILELRKQYQALVMIDEAHSMGVIGQTGRGVGEHYGVKGCDVDIWMGTLSKSFASCGGYIAGSKSLIELLRYTVPGFFFSVGLSPQDAAAALESARLLKAEPERVRRLQNNSRMFLELAKSNGLDTGFSEGTAVIPILIRNSQLCLRLCDALFTLGINVQPVLAPAVPERESRLRFFMTSEHNEEQIRFTINKLVQSIADCQSNGFVAHTEL